MQWLRLGGLVECGGCGLALPKSGTDRAGPKTYIVTADETVVQWDDDDGPDCTESGVHGHDSHFSLVSSSCLWRGS